MSKIVRAQVDRFDLSAAPGDSRLSMTSPYDVTGNGQNLQQVSDLNKSNYVIDLA